MTQITLHEGQSEVMSDLFLDKVCRWSVTCASRGFGKSYLAATTAMVAAQELMQLPPEVPNKNVAIIAPSYQHVTDIYFPLLAYQLGLENFAIKSSRSAGMFWLPNNTTLKLWSYEASERMRGSGQYFVVADEVCSWKGAGLTLKESWESIIQPCITTRWSPANAARWGAPSPGRAMIISTPMGYNYFYEMFNRGEVDKNWKSYHYTYRDSPYLDVDEIERAKMTLDPLKFAREYEASFEDSGNNVFYMFKRKLHVAQDLPDFEAKETVHVALDFNVGVMASTIGARRGNQTHWLYELVGHPDTQSVAKLLKERYVDKGHKVIVYPDPTGKARKSSAAVGVTDFSILKAHGLQLLVKPKSPPIVDSVNAVNTQLQNARGDVNMFFHPRLVNSIRSMERTTWIENNPDSAQIDKKEGVEHWSDGIRYYADYTTPIIHSTTRPVQGFSF